MKKKYTLLILFSFLIFSTSFAKNISFSKGKTYEGDFKWGGIKYSFPQGQWIFFNKDNDTVPHTNILTRCIEFYQVENQILKGLFAVCDIVTGGKWTPQIAQILKNVLKKDKYDNCTLRSEYFYAQLFTKGTAMNCFKTRHLDIYKELNFPDDPEATIKYLKIILENKNIKAPKTMLKSFHFFFAPSVRDKGVSLEYILNPEFYGAPKTINGDENSSEYHRNNIDKFPNKKKFMNGFLYKQAMYHQNFEKNMKARKHHLLDFNQFVGKKSQDVDNKSISTQLKSLNELYKSGVLTKEEFEKAKKKILN